MAIDLQNLKPAELVRLLNSTPLGTVITSTRLSRQRNDAGHRIGDSRRINLVRYVSWLARERRKSKRATISYEERCVIEAERNRLKTMAGQDIGPIPAVQDAGRRARACADFRIFCETYFAAAFNLAWSDDHLKVIAKIQRAVIEGGLFAFAMPRGNGKTTLARIAGLWAILTGAREFVCLVGGSQERAGDLLEAIKTDLQGNALLLADFPEAVYPIVKLSNNARRQIGQHVGGESTHITWAADRLVFPTVQGSPASGSIITVTGMDSNIRGQQHAKMDGRIVRPSLVILDDPQTRESARSPSQTRYRLELLNGDVLGMAGPGKKIAGFMTCTKIYPGDLADQVLDRKRTPDWQGECTKMIYKFPRNSKLWDKYAQIRAESLRADGDGHEAIEFYQKHRDAMDAGAVVAWPARHNPDEISALQHAMNLKLRDEAAFFAEYQNEPVIEQASGEALAPEQVASKFNGRPRGQIPKACTRLTMFIDVHDALLYYVVCAWEENFTGYVVDYGTYPDQKRMNFTLRDARKTLTMLAPGAGKEGAIQAGLEALVSDYMAREWPRTDGAVLTMDKCLVDMGYLPGLVTNVRQKVGGAMMLSKGVGIKAGNKPLDAYVRHPGERFGHHWYMPNVRQTREHQHVRIDTNYWKSFVHDRLVVAEGDPGALSLFGRSAAEHRLFADHIAASEFWVRTEGHGRQVREWKIKPGSPDNHWLDCLVGCAAAASMLGVALPGTQSAPRPRRTVRSWAEMQQEARQRQGRSGGGEW
jgi:hypothetical protein